MTDLTFVQADGKITVITLSSNRIDRIASMEKGIPTYSTLEGLNFNVTGILKQFPDLRNKSIGEIKRTGLKRFKKHLKSFETEIELIDYLKDDLEGHGYKLLMIQKKGHRPTRVT